MDNLQKTIERNLFFKVDFDSKYKKNAGKIEQEIKFFLIGVLPVVVKYSDGKSERAVLNTPLEVGQGQFLRLMHGVKFSEIKKVKKMAMEKFKAEVDYENEAKSIFDRIVGAVNAIAEKKSFRDREIESIMIININK